jgi:propionyl-CoA carboxylase alpha chain
MPSTGRLTRYRPPAERSTDGVTVRNDTGVYEGGEISLYYDPMIAKLVTHAPKREQAIEAQADALDAFVIDGIRHNIPFLAALMAHSRWRAGKLSTGFIAEEFPDGFHPIAPEGKRAQVLAAVERNRVVRLGDVEQRLAVASEDDEIVIAFEHGEIGKPYVVGPLWQGGDPLWMGTVNGHRVAVQVRMLPNGFALAYRGVETKAYVYTETEATLARLMPVKKAADTGKQVLCPMPGLVVSISVKQGQEVKAGETVAVVEAMKMENVLRAEIDGTVKKINANPGDSLAVDAVILEFA